MSELNFLDPFIIQSGFDEKQFGPGGQVIQSYPKEYMDLKMIVPNQKIKQYLPLPLPLPLSLPLPWPRREI